MSKDMRGLTNFISDIRACKSQESEARRINKELANIRAKFGEKKQLNGYQKKKYICKLLFTFLLGHEVEFGHMEAVNLMSALPYSEKQIGYLFASVMLNEHHELMRLVIQVIKSDLASRDELHVCLALHCISNIGGKDTAAAVSMDVQRLLVADETPNSVKKKAALAMLRLFREAPDHISLLESVSRIIQLLTSPDTGVVTSVTSLVISVSSKHPDMFKGVVSVAVNRLHRIVMGGAEQPDYVYYQIPSPWLTVKLMRLLQIFPHPADSAVAGRLTESLNRILRRSQEMPPKLVNGAPTKPRPSYFNVNNACLIEAINLLAHYDNNQDLQIMACTILGNFLIHRDANMRFLALESLSVLALTEHSHEAVKKHQTTVLKALLAEKDPTMQRRAVDVLYALCDGESVRVIVGDLLKFLRNSDYSIREELVLKIAILAEKYVPAYPWYVDVMLNLVKQAGDHVATEVWHRVVQIIINHQEVQDYAAKTCYEALLDPSAHENMIGMGGYVLGEFGHLIANDPNSGPLKQLDVVQMHYPMVSTDTRALLLSTYAKLANLFPEIKPQVLQVLKSDSFVRNSDAELQQRANEYVQLLSVANPDVLTAVLEEMPPFSEAVVGKLQRLEDRKATVTDASTGALAARRRSKATTELKAVTATGHTGVSAPAAATSTATTIVGNDQFFDKFMLVNDGVLYENPVLQIGVKSEFHANLGRITIFYGNRGDAPMTNVSTRSYVPDKPDALKIDAQRVDSVIPQGVQLQQIIQVECVAPFSQAPVLEINLTYQSRPIVLALKLPALLHKFLEPLGSTLNSDTFFQKWNQLGGPPREVRQIIKSKEPVDVATLREKVTAFGFPMLNGIDPKPDNIVAGAILHTTRAQVGALLRAEPNAEAQMYRFTMRTSSDSVSAILSNALTSQF